MKINMFFIKNNEGYHFTTQDKSHFISCFIALTETQDQEYGVKQIQLKNLCPKNAMSF